MSTLMIVLRDEPVEHHRIEELSKNFLDLRLPEGEWYYDFQDFMSMGHLQGCAVVFHGAKSTPGTIYIVADLHRDDAIKHQEEIMEAHITFAKISGGYPMPQMVFGHKVTTALVTGANVETAIQYALPNEPKPREGLAQFNLH